MNYFEIQDGSLLYRENGETVMVTPWGKDSLRIRGAFQGDIEPGSAALLEPDFSGEIGESSGGGISKAESPGAGTSGTGEAGIEIGEQKASITNGRIRAELDVSGWGRDLQITFYDCNGKMLLQEISRGGALQKKARHFKALPGGGYRLKASFAANPGEKIYGMGQYQQEIMDLKGCNLELAHRNSQASIPFYISSLGYGFLWHNPAIGQVHFGSNTTEWEAENTRQLDYWITAGETPARILESYTRVTGRAPMMPEYGLGFWQCKLRYYNQEQVLQIAREYKRRGIPLDMLIIDYYHWPRCGDWRFDEEYFPDPEGMAREIQDMGIRLMVSVWPQVDWRSENYEEMKQQGLLVKSYSGIDVQMIFHGNNVFLDATNPRARVYVWEKCKKNYLDCGISAFWLDEAEPEFGTYDHENYCYHAGPALQVGNLYPREYARIFYEGLKEAGREDIVNLIRCAWVGSQRYGALVWSGDIMSDYADFRNQICAGLHMGLCGIPWWTTDIGGFHNGNIHDARFQELLIRWFQFGAFCPVMRLHGCRQPGENITNRAGEVREWTGADNEIWSYGEENYEIMKKFIRIRELMRDYIRGLMREAHEMGHPVMRPMFYEFPEDENCWDIRDAYMFGADILVAPICHEGAEERRVYLPKGAFFVHAGTGQRHEGGGWVEVKAPLDTLPVFLREGRQAYLIGQI